MTGRDDKLPSVLVLAQDGRTAPLRTLGARADYARNGEDRAGCSPSAWTSSTSQGIVGIIPLYGITRRQLCRPGRPLLHHETSLSPSPTVLTHPRPSSLVPCRPPTSLPLPCANMSHSVGPPSYNGVLAPSCPDTKKSLVHTGIIIQNNQQLNIARGPSRLVDPCSSRQETRAGS